MFQFRQNSFVQIVIWFILATLVGIVIGVVDAIFLKTLDATLHWRSQFALYYLGLPIFLYIIYLLARRVAPRETAYSTDAVIDKINTHQPLGLISTLKSLVLSILTMAVGGSVGKEAPGADAGAGVASCLARLMHMNPENRRKLMICGVSAGFAGVFGVPISGAIFGLEVLWVGHIFYEVMFPALIAGITAFQVTSYLGVNYLYHPMNFAPVLERQLFIKVVLAGLFFGLVSILFIELLKLAKVIFRYIAVKTSPFLRSFIGGSVLVVFGLLFSPLYLGLGLDGFNSVLAGQPLLHPLGFLIKSFTTTITLAAGGVGGIITPLFFIGAQAGAMLSAVLETDSATMAALGLVAVLAGTANTPLAASIMAIELFGAEVAPYATVACVISFLLSGRHSIFVNQRISFDKQHEIPLADPEQAHRMHPRKTFVLKTFRELYKHLLPTTKDSDKTDLPK